jgi:oligopeptide transport system substrate-binding protein
LIYSFLILSLFFSSCTSKKNSEPPLVTQSDVTIASNPQINQQPQDAANSKRTFTFRLPGDPETLDWNKAHTSVETYLLTNLMEGLVTHDSKMNVIPALAESWTKSPDGKQYTFKIRNDVKWSDGVPLTARDFLYSWKRLLSPITSASYAYLLFDIENAEDFYNGKVTDFSKVGVRAPDDFTLVVQLSKPIAHFIHIPTFWVTYPLRQDIVEKYGTSWASPGRMVTVGPFTLSSYDLDSKIVLAANPQYYGAHGNVEQAVGLIVKEDSTALTLYESGKIDFLTDISSLDLKRLQDRGDLHRFPYLKTGYVGFVLNKFPVNNVHFRKAIAHAVDKKRIQEFLYGEQSPTNSFVPEGMFGFNRSIGLKYDPELAKKELKLSGFNPQQGSKIDLVCPNWEKALTIAQFLQAELKKNLGVEVNIQTFDHKTFRAQIALYSYPMFILSWSADYPDPDNFMSVFLSMSGNNRLMWKNSEYDAKVLLARFNQNSKARERLYDETQKILVETDTAILPLYNEPILALIQPRVKDLEINSLNYLRIKKINLETKP